MGVIDRIKNAWKQPVPAAEAKDVIQSSLVGETERGGRHKGFIPNFLWKPPYGYPRFQNINEIRSFARTPHVWMAVDTVATECAMMDWDVRVKPEVLDDMSKEEAQTVQKSLSEQRRHIMSFLRNPNTNKESMYHLIYKTVVDTLEINAGVIAKIFDLQTMVGGEPRLVEIVSRDGGTFLKNPDIHGMLTTRENIVPVPLIREDSEGRPVRSPNEINKQPTDPLSTQYDPGNSNNAAYYQYGYNVAMRAVPYGKQELIWIEKSPRTDTLYGPSPVEIALTIVKVLLYGTEDMLQYYVNNNIPKGAFVLEGANQEQMDAFKEQWFNQMHTRNSLNQQVRKFWQVPFTNKKSEFVRFQFSPAELELISQQEWLSKLVWACMKITPSELGFTEDSNKATEGGQERAHKRKALDPLLSLIEYHFNTEILSEFGPEYEDLEFYFPEHDLDKEKKQAEVYSLEVKNGLRTVNEVRGDMGLEPVEWGDNPPNGYNSSIEQDLESALQDDKRRDDIKATLANQLSKASLDNQKAEETKATGTDVPLVLQEGERLDEERVEEVLTDMMRLIEEAAIDTYKKQTGMKSRYNPKELKSIGDRIMNTIKSALPLDAIKRVVQSAIKDKFLEGHEDIEKSLNRNFQPDKDAMQFLETHTFDNVKGLAEDSITKLRGVLERGLMDGKGPDAVAKDVQRALAVEKPRAQAIARTELNRARNAGVETTIKKNNIKGKLRWKASGDRSSERATKLCTQLDGQEVPVGENFKGSAGGLSFEGPRPPAHVNCRSRMEFVPDFE